jgi:predicted esterase
MDLLKLFIVDCVHKTKLMSKRLFNNAFLFTMIVLFIMVGACRKNTITDGGNLGGDDTTTCNEYGALPFNTVYPVTLPLKCEDGDELTYQQGSAIRFACLNYPDQADSMDYKWPLIVYIHGSLVTPMSLYTFGRNFFDLRNDFKLSDNDTIKGFITLSPEGRIAKPWPTGSDQPATGEGFHWDEWYRNPDDNLDADAIDNFIDQVISDGKVDTSRIYVFGWSNGAYMTVLYSTWRSSRIAAMGQYAGANPWSRNPCPIPMSYTRQVPLFLMRNLCDALVPCETTNDWIDTLTVKNWPFKYHNLDVIGEFTTDDTCSTNPGCSGDEGLAQHMRWPRKTSLEIMLEYFRLHPLN